MPQEKQTLAVQADKLKRRLANSDPLKEEQEKLAKRKLHFSKPMDTSQLGKQELQNDTVTIDEDDWSDLDDKATDKAWEEEREYQEKRNEIESTSEDSQESTS